MEIKAITDKILKGAMLDEAEAYSLTGNTTAELCEAASKVTAVMFDRKFDSCSIINARSGRCPENCKWCAQSAHYNTGCDVYDMVPEDECMEMARYNDSHGVHRFSLVASGKSAKGKALDQLCAMYRRIGEETSLSCCASLGLLGKEELQKLWDSGVRRYHCNLESAPSHFPALCTTHTIDDKMVTIRLAREIGFEICSGGIIGMGETERQRVEFAMKLREVSPASIPINILCPIPGTPLENAAPLSDEEILRTVAIFRLVHPKVYLRFAGGRKKLSPSAQLEALRIGINGSIVGDMLTTVGSRIAEDRDLVSRAGYTF